ncbi:Serine/threonine-protein kinase KSP1 [Fusarium oxysporum f. sp. conglutinans]|nr:Serine/threonine-protein kinase KSP1 [Fusarium oxysporum f. sp. conglutinans]
MSQLTISSYPMDQLVDHFRAEVERVSVSGVNGEDKVVSYVPLSALKRYWTVKRVNNILNCPTNPISENPRVIIESHLQIFSTLVYKGFCDRISWFFRSNPKNLDDHNLPFDAQVFDRTYDWSNSFLEHQWMFCPAEFADRRYHKRIFDSKVILPVTHLSDIRPKRRGPDGAILRKYQLNSHSNSIVPNNKTIVFKIYEGHEGEDRYNAETDVYVMLDKLSNDCIAKDIASFCFRGTHKFIIVLEYAEGGSLTDYLQRSLTPVTPEETTLLWEQLFNLIDALYLLSSIYQQTPMQQQTLVGIHQDIHPGNILVFPKVDGRSPFDVKFKLTDFGLAGMGRVSPQDRRLRTANRGNRMYVAPEVFSNFSIQDSCDVGISPIADIWSLGALFSDILVWTIAGEQGREEYCLRRSTEISQYRHLRAANHDCCFHDGEQRLNSIEDVHNEVMKHKRSSDSISPLISDLILDHMLVGPRERLDAMQIRTYAARKFKENQKGNAAAKLPSDGIFSTPTPVNPNRDPVKPPNRQTPERRATMPPNGFKGHSLPEGTSMPYPPTAEPSHIGGTNMNQQNHQQNGNIISEERVVTVKQVYPMIVEKNSRFSLGRLFGADPSKSDEIMELHGMQEARSKISENNGRDQILLFDNFESMQTHKRKAMKTARVISYVAKEADDDGMEVYAASKTAKGPIKCKNSTEVEAAIGKFKTVKGKCKLRKCLDDILNRVLKKDGFKPTSIYILTDGVWEPGDDQVKFAIIRAINFLIEHRLPSSALMFQFVQFGNDQKGEARMRRLDDEYKKETEDED